MKSKIELLRKQTKNMMMFVGVPTLVLAVVALIAVVPPPTDSYALKMLYIFAIPALVGGATLGVYTIACAQNVGSLSKSYTNSSGLHSWRELPKEKVLSAVKRIDERGTGGTVLAIIGSVVKTSDTGSVLQYFFFDQGLPDSILPTGGDKGTKIIILHSREELLHKDFEAGVIVLLTNELEPPDKGTVARRISESLMSTASVPKSA